jgi:hypothetical protein
MCPLSTEGGTRRVQLVRGEGGACASAEFRHERSEHVFASPHRLMPSTPPLPLPRRPATRALAAPRRAPHLPFPLPLPLP